LELHIFIKSENPPVCRATSQQIGGFSMLEYPIFLPKNLLKKIYAPLSGVYARNCVGYAPIFCGYAPKNLLYAPFSQCCHNSSKENY
jgi:hypothetical protein